MADHEKLDVYHRSAAVAAALDKLASSLPPRRKDIRAQLQRAALSIPLNIAEGAGEFSPGAKANFYRIARRSATECMSILDVMARIEGNGDRYRVVLDELRIVTANLTALVLSVERRADRR